MELTGSLAEFFFFLYIRHRAYIRERRLGASIREWALIRSFTVNDSIYTTVKLSHWYKLYLLKQQGYRYRLRRTRKTGLCPETCSPDQVHGLKLPWSLGSALKISVYN